MPQIYKPMISYYIHHAKKTFSIYFLIKHTNKIDPTHTTYSKKIKKNSLKIHANDHDVDQSLRQGQLGYEMSFAPARLESLKGPCLVLVVE
jgi:hypothetical protein